jgi:carbon storage regulator CsrA
MLIVRRRAGQAIVVDADVEIEILEITPSQVKLGIRAPRATQVLRKEVVLTREQNLASACSFAPDLASWNETLGDYLPGVAE